MMSSESVFKKQIKLDKWARRLKREREELEKRKAEVALELQSVRLGITHLKLSLEDNEKGHNGEE